MGILYSCVFLRRVLLHSFLNISLPKTNFFFKPQYPLQSAAPTVTFAIKHLYTGISAIIIKGLCFQYIPFGNKGVIHYHCQREALWAHQNMKPLFCWGKVLYNHHRL